MDVSITTIGKNKGAKRVWLEGAMLNRAGFSPKTRYQIKSKNGAVILIKQAVGFRIVSSRTKADKEIPIIDINNGELLAMFEGLEHVRVIFKEGEIHILPLASELRAKERLLRVEKKIINNEPLSFGSLAHGGGVLDAALEEGLNQAGIPSYLAFANEIRADLTEHVLTLGQGCKDFTTSLNGGMQELAFDEYVMNRIGHCDVISAGLPCSGASVAGRSKGKLAHPESHKEIGHLVVAFLSIIARVNPVAILLENVVPYQNSASMEIIRSQLRDLHYEVHETVLHGEEFGAFEHRKRMAMVAVTKGMSFSFDNLVKPVVEKRPLSDILETIALDDPRWKLMDGLKAKEMRDAEAGNSFAMQIFDGSSEKICTLTKGMMRNRSSDAKIRHPVNPDLLRIPTPLEHARAKQIPPSMIVGLSPTIAHELLGQSVIFKPFVAVGCLLGECFKKLVNKSAEIPFSLSCG